MTRHLAKFARVAILAAAAPATRVAPASAAPCHRPHAAVETMLRIDAHTLLLCWQSPDACFALDLGAKSPAWTLVARPKSSPAFGPAQPIPGVTVGMTVDVCGADGTDCRDFVVPPGPVTALSATYALANADRSLIAAVTERAITLFDGAGAKRGTIDSWKPDTGIGWSFEGIWFYGDRVYVEMTAGHDAELRVFAPTGAKVAVLGDGDAGIARAAPLALADGTLAVATAYGEKLDLRDKLGKRIKLVDVFGPVQAPKLSDRAEQVALVPDGRIAVARGDGSVALVDVASGGHALLPPPPVCK